MTSPIDRGALLGAALAALLVASAGVVHRAQAPMLERAREQEFLYYPSGVAVRQAALGYETAAADVAWLRAIQYYGEHRLTDRKFEMIGHVMRIVTELDPRFIQPYVFGAFVLAQEMNQPDRGLELLARGMRENPDDWTLAFEAGFLHYVCRRDYEAAARYFTLASRIPGHEPYVERFAAFAHAKSGNEAMSILLWKRVLATGNEYMQEVARRELARMGAI